jgi:hypothetical protein
MITSKEEWRCTTGILRSLLMKRSMKIKLEQRSRQDEETKTTKKMTVNTATMMKRKKRSNEQPVVNSLLKKLTDYNGKIPNYQIVLPPEGPGNTC